MSQKITEKTACNVLNVVSKGLVHGLGKPKPGQMCVEAAVCYAMGEPHGDRPSCVDEDVSAFKISLNDSDVWLSNKDRANGLKALAIAQLGSRDHKGINKFEPLLYKKVKSALYKKIEASLKDDKLSNLKKKLLKLVPNANNYAIEAFLGDIGYDVDANNTEDFEDAFSDNTSVWSIVDYISYTNDLTDKQRREFILKIADLAVQTLKELKVPGTKYLYLLKKDK